MPSSKKKARERILEAAVESFQTQGYARTTTHAIAQKAGVAEITLFRHFGDKQTLFQAAVQQIGGGPTLDVVEANLTYDLETDLRLICQHSLHFFIAQQNAIRMLMFETIHFPEMKTALAQNPQGMIELLVRYFQKQIDAGNLQVVDCQTTAQTFVSMLFGYAVGVHLIKDLLPAEVALEMIIDEFVRIFLAALRPAEQ